MANRQVPFVDGMKIGLGYDRLSGDIMASPAVQGTSITALQGAGGQLVTSDCVTIRDLETLHKSLGVSVDAGGSYMGFSAGAKVDYVNKCDFSSFSTYVLIFVSVHDAFESIDSPTFTPDAEELIKNNNPARFRQRFGDNFISGIKKGGEYFAIYQISGSDQTERESLSVDVHAAFNGIVASAHLSVLIQTATDKSKSHLEVRVPVFRQGTISQADLNLEDIMATAKQFPLNVAGDKAFPYSVMIQDYAELRSPNDAFNYLDIQQQQDVLADLAAKRFEFITLKNDLSYILRNLDDFENKDGTTLDRAALVAMQARVVAAINTMEREATKCSRDASQCAFTVFDVGAFERPQLKPAHVPVPLIVGLSVKQVWDSLVTPGLASVEAIDQDAEGRWMELALGLIDEDGDVRSIPHTSTQLMITEQAPAAGTTLSPGTAIRVRVDLMPGVPEK